MAAWCHRFRRRNDWKFANNDENLGKLKRLQGEVAKSLTDFGQMFLQKNNKEVNQIWSSEYLEGHLPSFIDAKQAIDRLQRQIDNLNEMHQVMMSHT